MEASDLLIAPCLDCGAFGLVVAIRGYSDGRIEAQLSCGHVATGDELGEADGYLPDGEVTSRE